MRNYRPGWVMSLSLASLLVSIAFGLLLPAQFASSARAAMTNGIGEYFANVIGMSLVMTPYTGEDWVERWTIFAMLDLLPFSGLLGPLTLLLVVLFVVTSANSATFVLGIFTGKGVLVPGRALRLTWGVVQALVAGVLLLSGGLDALQTVSILAAFPFMILMVFMAGSLLKSLRDERRQQELHEALIRERLLRLLDAHDVQSLPVEGLRDAVDYLDTQAAPGATGDARDQGTA